jgi:hypothetical protein
LGPVTQAANDLFTTDQMKALTKEEHLINKKLCLNNLFYQYVIETNISAFFDIANVKYTLKKESLPAFQSLAKQQRSRNSSNSLSKVIYPSLNQDYESIFFSFQGINTRKGSNSQRMVRT